MQRNGKSWGMGLGVMVVGCGWAMAAQEHGGAAAAGAKPAKAEVGKPAPDFALKDTDGKEVKLSSFKGKIVVLEWTNHECPVVRFHHGENDTMLKTLEGVKGKDVVWLAVDSSWFCQDKLSAIKSWAAEKKLPYPILLDPTGATGRAYDARTTPHMFIIDKTGTLAYAGAIDDNRKMEQGKTNAKNYVADALKSLIAGETVAVKSTDSYGCSVKYKQ